MPAPSGPVEGLRCETGAHQIRWISAVGEVVFPRTQRAVFEYVQRGHYDVALVIHVWKLFDEFAATRPGKLHAFVDMSGHTGYDTETRRLAAEGFKQRADRWDTFHALLPSGFTARLVSMGFTVINMVSRVPMKTYTDRKTFEAARTKALGR